MEFSKNSRSCSNSFRRSLICIDWNLFPFRNIQENNKYKNDQQSIQLLKLQYWFSQSFQRFSIFVISIDFVFAKFEKKLSWCIKHNLDLLTSHSKISVCSYKYHFTLIIILDQRYHLIDYFLICFLLLTIDNL